MRERITTPLPIPTNEDHYDRAISHWLESVRVIIRKAFRGDDQTFESALAKTMATRIAKELTDVVPKARFASLPGLVKDREPTEGEIVAARALSAKRQAIRDRLAQAIGKKDSETWDDAYHRAASRQWIAVLGRVLARDHVVTEEPTRSPSLDAQAAEATA